MRILLIAGHGAGDPGAVATVNGKQYREAEETRKLADALELELKPYNVTVLRFDSGKNAYTEYKNGTLQLPAADYVLEIHMNAGAAPNADKKTTGAEIFVTTDEAAVTVEEKILRNIAALGFTNRGVKRKNFSVIRFAKNRGMSSALLETCFIDDPEDMVLYEKNRADIAKAIAAGMAEGFGLAKQASGRAPEDALPWAQEAWQQAYSRGILDGTRPFDPVTRQELAVVLARFSE